MHGHQLGDGRLDKMRHHPVANRAYYNIFQRTDKCNNFFQAAAFYRIKLGFKIRGNFGNAARDFFGLFSAWRCFLPECSAKASEVAGEDAFVAVC
jgi:hypothetical protein